MYSLMYLFIPFLGTFILFKKSVLRCYVAFLRATVVELLGSSGDIFVDYIDCVFMLVFKYLGLVVILGTEMWS